LSTDDERVEILQSIADTAQLSNKLGAPITAQLLEHILFLLEEGDFESIVILERHAKRYRAGHLTYGPMDIQTDKRKFLRELADEIYDSLYYLEAELLREEQK
jgi:hypothetical protein